jgi:hypothetical protein
VPKSWLPVLKNPVAKTTTDSEQEGLLDVVEQFPLEGNLLVDGAECPAH